MKQTEITKLSQQELEAKLVSVSDSLKKMKFGHTVSPIENPLQIRAIRRTIARLNTELSKRKNQA